MATPEDVEYEEVVVTGLEIWFTNGQKYQATLVPPDTYENINEVQLKLIVYSYDERCAPATTDINLMGTNVYTVNQWIQKYPVHRLRKVVPAVPSGDNWASSGFEGSSAPDPKLQKL